jgi:hypothetical protein
MYNASELYEKIYKKKIYITPISFIDFLKNFIDLMKNFLNNLPL